MSGLHLNRPGRDPDENGSPPYRLFHPECAGASLRYYEICPRCGATVSENCGDDEAFAVQDDAIAKACGVATAPACPRPNYWRRQNMMVDNTLPER